MNKKTYDLKNLHIVILAQMTFIKKPTLYKYGEYKAKSLPGAYFAEKTTSPTQNVFNLVTKNKCHNNNPEDNLRKGSKFVVKEYDAGLVFAMPILITGVSVMTKAQLKTIEKSWEDQGFINLDSIADSNKELLNIE